MERPRIAKVILRRKNKARDITLPDVRQHHKTTGIKTAWCWHKDRYMDRWNITESREINPHTYGQLTYDKGARIYNGEKTVSSASGAGKAGQPHINQGI